MARPRICSEPRVATAVRLPTAVHERLHAAAADRDVSANLLVTRAVTEFLDRLPPAEVALGGTTPPAVEASPDAGAGAGADEGAGA